jgi:hypothetical protein
MKCLAIVTITFVACLFFLAPAHAGIFRDRGFTASSCPSCQNGTCAIPVVAVPMPVVHPVVVLPAPTVKTATTQQTTTTTTTSAVVLRVHRAYVFPRLHRQWRRFDR